MKILSIDITNFRGLAKIDADITQLVSVIVGPNAIGKTSILEAIRVTKAVLAPRIHNDADVTLAEMGALQNQILQYEALAGDVLQKLEVIIALELTPEEVATLGRNAPRIVMKHIRNLLGIPQHQPDFTLAQFMSTEQGRVAQKRATSDVHNRLASLPSNRKLKLHLRIEEGGASISGQDIFAHEFLSALEASLDPASALLSYFPADRAMPTGEVNIQIGSADVHAKLQAHLAQPGAKYARLKNIIVNQMLMGKEAADSLKADFSAIFHGLLVGKRLEGLSLGKNGGLAVLIAEEHSGKTYDLDRMSSGEKGLILQFLLMRHSIEPGGIVLIDEPEIHLNPAVCKKLLPFFIDQVFKPRNIQAIICTHSPDILATAFDRPDCALFHLRSGKDLSPIHREDKAEVFEACKRLGAGTSDILFSKGTLFVEGIHDAELLEAGFAKRLGAVKIMQLRGRSEIEKEIKTLQKEETDGNLTEAQYFVFDRDRKLTDLTTSPLVRFKQWERYCLENYLLESEAIYDACKDYASAPPDSRGSLKLRLRELAMLQINGVVARSVYKDLEPLNCGLRASDVDGRETYDAIAEALAARIEEMRVQVADRSHDEFVKEMVAKCKVVHQEIKTAWDESWQTECDGKKVLQAVHREFKIKGSPLDFKKRVIGKMEEKTTESWRAVDSLLDGLLVK